MPQFEANNGGEHVQAAQPASFYERNRAHLAEVFTVLDKPLAALDNLEETVRVTQEWIRGDHTRPDYEIDLGADESDKLRELYGMFGLLDEKLLPPGHYEQIIL